MKITYRNQADIDINSPITLTDTLQLQQILHQHHYALLPQEFINFLYLHNGMNNNGNIICGIKYHHQNDDILTINQQIKHPLHKDLIFLGFDEFDYLAYNQKHQIYQIIDKSDFEVIEEYQDFASALQYILKIEDE